MTISIWTSCIVCGASFRCASKNAVCWSCEVEHKALDLKAAINHTMAEALLLAREFDDDTVDAIRALGDEAAVIATRTCGTITAAVESPRRGGRDDL